MSEMASNSPSVTIIIATYNRSVTLRLSLETVLLQDFTNFEVWIIGDGCTDDSGEVVSSFNDDRLHWFNLPSNSGTPSLPRNEGLRRARGEFVAYLNHDDLWFPWHLSGLMSCIEQNNSDFVFSLGAIIGKDGVAGSYCVPKGPTPSNWLHRKALTEIIGLWSPDVKYATDVDFLERVLSTDLSTAFRQQISVLKFPAAWWQMYALTSDFPQSKYVETMHRNPEALHLEILLELATVVARSGSLKSQYKGFLPKPLRSLIWRTFAVYGMQRWPVA
ncbi:glycosyltransferase family 2 protein, partial [Thermodesulfobacteriota bacterium]